MNTPPQTNPVFHRPWTQPADMVRAMLEGRKTQVRIPFKDQPSSDLCILNHLSRSHIARLSPWVPGNILWIREVWGFTPRQHDAAQQVVYKATEQTWKDNPFIDWRSPVTMPLEYCRLFVQVTDRHAQRIQEITHADSINEGVINSVDKRATRFRMENQWNRQHAHEGLDWDVNPWVWVYSLQLHWVRDLEVAKVG